MVSLGCLQTEEDLDRPDEDAQERRNDLRLGGIASDRRAGAFVVHGTKGPVSSDSARRSPEVRRAAIRRDERPIGEMKNPYPVRERGFFLK
ncbi:MAG: hypothetical protein NVS2B9_06890 [Myxococcales bacterium]